ncbi:cell wall-binding repeat-containing protein [Peptostreptococcus stomatis]|uniref:cell wall-binding repeat-containing protein n=1 Tax=Peptostreptococcus stomatis TaxID=341694 RepID=UPI003F9F24D7
MYRRLLINGEKSADALTVSSLATKSDIPVLLVNSRKIDSSVKSKLDSWNVNELLIVGGSGSIPNSIVNNIRANKKRRIAGADRFDTAIEIAKESYSNTKTVMLSNGYNAIDALSAGAVIEKAQAPILLVRKDSIPSKVRSMVDNNSSKAVLLGGVNTISSWVESSLNK